MPPTDPPMEPQAPGAFPHWSEVLRALREARGVTQGGWAAQLGVSSKTVQRWERGERVPDPGAEAAILRYCQERNLLRSYDRGPLAGLDLTADYLQELIATARWRVDDQPRPSGSSPRTVSVDKAERVAPAAPAALQTNLPVQLTSFVGRQREIATVSRLQTGTRLLTLTGAGGCGKTRLALRVADELLRAYPDGVCFVDLAALVDPAYVARAVADAVGMRAPEPRPVEEALQAFLRPRSMLLVLDNCEHLVVTCAPLIEILLRACPQVAVMATSREPLGITGETVWPVPPMALPDSPINVSSTGDTVTVESAMSSNESRASEAHLPDSVVLFVERARLYRSEFALTRANAVAVTELCRRLDGIPLAIELAAARVRALSVEQIAARLDDRLRLLTGGSRTALPRHQTLLAALDWSYDLLTSEEQALLRRLSIFTGGFALEAAEAVGSDAVAAAGPTAQWQSPAAHVLDNLASLVDKSLVIAEQHGGTVRYRLSETVRQYAAEKLNQAGDLDAPRDRHLGWYFALLQSAEAAFHGRQEADWLTRIEHEHGNLRAALAWALQRDDPGLPLQMGAVMTTFWERRGYLHEGQRWLALALEAGRTAPAGMRARALLSAGVLAELLGDSAAARAFHDESLSLFLSLDDRDGIALAKAHLGRITFRLGDLPGAQALLEQSLALFQELDRKPEIADVLGRLGLIALRQGDIDAAHALTEARLVIERDVGNKDGAADALEVLATVAGERGEHARQLVLLEESLALYREVGNRLGVALAIGGLGIVAWLQRDDERAQTLLSEGLALYREVRDSRGIARLLSYQATVALYQGAYVQAEALVRESLTLYQDMGDAWSIGRYLPVLAGAALGQGQLERAARLFAAATGLRTRLATPMPAILRDSHDRAVAAVRRRLGDDTFAATWSAGETMTLDDVMSFALGTSTQRGTSDRVRSAGYTLSETDQ